MERTATQRLRAATNGPLVAFVVVLAGYGAVVVHSATATMSAGDAMFARQLVGIGAGIALLVAAWVVDYQRLKDKLALLLLLDVALILSPQIPGLGVTAGGATSWLQIGGIRLFQPSEPAKLVTIVVLAIVISRYEGRIEAPRDVARVLGVLLLPFVLTLLQPDLGTGLVFLAIAMGMLLVGGLRLRWFGVFALAGILAVALALSSGVLESYQEDRLLVFVDPSRDPAGAGYNLAQSKIAIGSGGLTGKGLGSGTQSNLNFVPERHTDFIFSVLGEELGFIGGVVLLGLYLALFATSLEVSASSRDLFGALIAAGVISMWVFQVVVNVGMTMGLMPVTGIPLPFMSFGSSFMVTNLAATGMLLSIWSRRYGT